MIGRDGSGEEFDGLSIGRMTGIGLVVAALGWALLLGEIAMTDFVGVKFVRPLAPTFHTDVVDLGECLIGSGFGLAIVGGLQSGFGTLNRFFGAVLNRSNQRSADSAQPAPHIMPREPQREPRPYRTLPDGSVEVETILGTRRFDTMTEAREFI